MFSLRALYVLMFVVFSLAPVCVSAISKKCVYRVNGAPLSDISVRL